MINDVLGKRHKFLLGLILLFVCMCLAYLPLLAAAADDGRGAEGKKEAEKEGKLVWYTSLTSSNSAAFAQRFQKKYPLIKVELNHLLSPQILTRVTAEQRAKKSAVDVIATKSNAVYLMQKMGLFAKYLSPERKFYAEEFKDKEGYWTDLFDTFHGVVFNTRLVAPHEVPVTYQDLLKPRWKGKIGFNPANITWLEAVMQIMGKEEGLKYLEALARQNLSVRDGGSLNIILAAAGELAMAVPVNTNIVEKEKAKGAPVDWARIKPYYGDLHPIALADNAPHPYAGRLFIDYVLSQEGQEVLYELGDIPARKGFKSKIVRSEEINIIDPALGGEKMDYYQKLIKQLFARKQ